MQGKLYLCATPIGNLDDITIRVLDLLKSVDIIAAEDTRHSKKLLNHYNISTPLTSYHEHNKYTKTDYLINKLKDGVNIALVTDAGTPGISDPGEELVKKCHEHDIEVTAAPGAVALTTGLIISGQSTRRFVFEGFIPTDKREQKQVFERIKDETRTIIVYEAPHRLKQTLKKLLDVLDDRSISITRELTKKHEEVLVTTLSQAIDKYATEDPRGEYVLVIKGKDINELKQEKIEGWLEYSLEEHMKVYIDQGKTHKEAMKLVAKDRGVTKREIYSQLHKES